MEQLELGQALRDQGIARVDAAEDPAWRAAADVAIAELAASGEEFTAEDVRRIAGDPTHPNAMGARFRAAAQAGIIRRVGYRASSRVQLHAHPIAVWVGRSA